MNQKASNLSEEIIGKIILDSAFKVHDVLGAGLLESAYESALILELKKRGLSVERQKSFAVYYEGELLDAAFRVDLLIEKKVLIEFKSPEASVPAVKKITANYLRLLSIKLGFLINFNETNLRNGITWVTHGLDDKEFFQQTPDLLKIGLKNPAHAARSAREL